MHQKTTYFGVSLKLFYFHMFVHLPNELWVIKNQLSKLRVLNNGDFVLVAVAVDVSIDEPL